MFFHSFLSQPAVVYNPALVVKSNQTLLFLSYLAVSQEGYAQTPTNQHLANGLQLPCVSIGPQAEAQLPCVSIGPQVEAQLPCVVSGVWGSPVFCLVPLVQATSAPMLGCEVIPAMESTATSTTSAPASAHATWPPLRPRPCRACGRGWASRGSGPSELQSATGWTLVSEAQPCPREEEE